MYDMSPTLTGTQTLRFPRLCRFTITYANNLTFATVKASYFPSHVTILSPEVLD
jgi:hypothetical protein